jgi:hypothetical protein
MRAGAAEEEDQRTCLVTHLYVCRRWTRHNPSSHFPIEYTLLDSGIAHELAACSHIQIHCTTYYQLLPHPLSIFTADLATSNPLANCPELPRSIRQPPSLGTSCLFGLVCYLGCILSLTLSASSHYQTLSCHRETGRSFLRAVSGQIHRISCHLLNWLCNVPALQILFSQLTPRAFLFVLVLFLHPSPFLAHCPFHPQ